MLIKQNNDTFIRFFGDVGYIKNQRLNLDLVYNETGKYYLSQISRQPREFDDILDSLMDLFTGSTREIIEDDFSQFVDFLESSGFICTGNDTEELNLKESAIQATHSSVKTNYSIVQQDIGITHSSALLFKLFKQHPQIFDIQIELTRRCNEKCIHCYLPIKERASAMGRSMTTKDVKSVLDQAAAMGVLGVTFSGGELLLRKDLYELLQYAREKDLIINLFSNVVLLTPEIVAQWKALNVNTVQVSLYSMDPAIHEAVTGVKCSYERTRKGIELLVENGINVIISCPVMKINRFSFRDVLAYAESLHIKAGGDYQLIGQGDLNTSNLSQRMSIHEAEEFLTDMVSNNEEYRESLKSKVDNYDFEERTVEDKLACGVGIDTINIAANGDIIPCPGWDGFVLGNVSTDRIEEVWTKSEKLNELREIRLSQFPRCVKCDARPFCYMCLLRNFNESNGDMFKVPANTCQIAHLRKRLFENL